MDYGEPQLDSAGLMRGTLCQQADNSHDNDQSKYLKHEQIVAVSDAVTIALQGPAGEDPSVLMKPVRARPTLPSCNGL